MSKKSFGRGLDTGFNRGTHNRGSRHGYNHGAHNQFREEYNPFGSRRLIEFLTLTNDEVIMALDKSVNNFQQNLRQECSIDMMILLIQIIGEKVCGETSLHEFQNKIMALSSDTPFLEKILKFTSQIPSLKIDPTNREIIVDQCKIRILNALSAFFGLLCARMPALAVDKLLPYIEAAYNINELLSLKGILPIKNATEIGNRFNMLIQEIQTKKDAAQKKSCEKTQRMHRRRHEMTTEECEKLYQLIPEKNFSEIEIIPSKEELLSDEEPFLRPNLIDGKYPSTLTYLDVQFRLLREDFLAPLRESVKEYLSSANENDSRKRRPSPGTIRIYRDVRLQKVECTLEVTLFTMKFVTTHLKRVKWENSKRLLTGSLLILSPDRFNTVYFATVGRRDEKKLPYGLIDIVWEGERPDTYVNVTFLMIECEVYFESYRHTLKALQEMAKPCPPLYDRPRLETFEMSKYIVNVSSKQIPPPKYLRNRDWNDERIDFKMLLLCNKDKLKLQEKTNEENNSSIVRKIDDIKSKLPEMENFAINPLELSKWPSAEQLGMDLPQYHAFQAAVTQELSIIQGPPGTGKTYIGLEIMKLLLANPLIASRCPILVVCYTNHALDQFLEGIIAIMNSLQINPYGKLIRVGGRSKVEEIQEYNIRKISRDYSAKKKFDANYAQLRSRTRGDLLLQKHYRDDLKSLYCDLNNLEGIVNFSRLDVQIANGESTDDLGLLSIFPKNCCPIFLSNSRKSLFNWLLMSSREFDSERISIERILHRHFKFISITRKQFQEANVDEMPEEELEDEELRNILLAHRMEEEILEEDREYKAARLEYIFHHTEIKDFDLRNNKLYDQYQNAQQTHDFKAVKYLQGQMYELGSQEIKFKNQSEFIKGLFRGYKDGRIDLPKVTTDLLARVNEWMTMSEKWAIYFHFIEEAKKFLIAKIIKMEVIIMEAQKKMVEVINQGDGFILSQAQVVGITTTGAAKYNTVLRMMQSKIVIVEEAAEVLESHIVASITEHCQHLILIGDHQQLRPPTTVYTLAKDYQLDISLFERLIRNKVSWRYLRAQHRMRPEICKLLVPTIYSDLENHSSVDFYPPIKGFLKNLFFVNHIQPETADTDSMTKSNEYEARYITQLSRHLVLQGYHPSKITILTTYIGQMFLINKFKLEEGDTCRGIRVTVVDNFQGEENDIILLSLVRSNEERKIGFLKTDNRICVALSRAKHGFYIVGNMECLVNSPSTTWQRISNELQDQDSIGPGLKLRCQNHDDIIDINSPEEFRQKSPEGGCTKMCTGVLPRCDHACRNICHIIDSEHKMYECRKTCERHCPDPAMHKCPGVCYVYPCRPCETKMKRLLPCSHEIELQCHVDISTYECQELVPRLLSCSHSVSLKCCVPVEKHVCTIKEKKLLDCGEGHTKLLPCNVPATKYECVETVRRKLECDHEGTMKCVDDPSKFDCKEPCSRELLCGHQQIVPCMEEIKNIKCLTMVDEIKPDCKHKVQIPCHQQGNPEKWICLTDCDTRLNCGHQCVRKCHLNDDPDHLNYRCSKNCARSCVNDHPCRLKHRCHEACAPCRRATDKELECGHKINVYCSDNIANYKCTEPCKREELSCGHKCLKMCSLSCEPCTEMKLKKSIDCPHTFEVPCYESAKKLMCNEMVPSRNKSLCGHIVNVPCRIQYTCSPDDCTQYCHEPCDYKFDYEGGCGHTCQGDCASCYQGKIHVKCNSQCGRTLACGHVCKFPCSFLCPPCKDVCILQCKHSKCKKKCGEPCVGCKESCKWACEHAKCGKKCFEICNRDPCNEPCKKKLKCSHDCIGSCGEPCPPLCRVCDKEIVQEIMFGEEGDDDARFVYLENCGHIIHRESMDQWMLSKAEGSAQNQINVKRCPKCTTIITRCVRYGNVIKKHFKNVLRIRSKIFGNDRNQKETQQNIAKQIQHQGSKECHFENVRDFLENKLFVMKQVNTKFVLHLLNVDQYTFETLHNIHIWWMDAEENVKINEVYLPPQERHRRIPPPPTNQQKPKLTVECRTELITMYNKLFKLLLTKILPLSSHEIEDFDQEFTKMNDFYRLGLRRGIDKFDSFVGAPEIYSSAQRHIMQNKPYDESMQADFKEMLLRLEEKIKTGWESVKQKHESDARKNREQIFSAMGFAGNHWYTCPNNHLYVVADCGALNQSGNCPECRSLIGGGSRIVHAIRNETAIQQQINSVVEIFPERAPPTFEDRKRNAARGRKRGGYRGQRR